MKLPCRCVVAAVLFTLLQGSLAAADPFDFSLDLSAQTRVFPMQPPHLDQPIFTTAAAVQPKVVAQWDNRRQSFEASLFFRYDQTDSRRTHFDISEFSYVKAWDAFELRAGIRKVFWGVAESQHLLDILNQLDIVEDFRGYTKLGQPMVNVALVTKLGTFELYVMPYFRMRTFPGIHGHFRGPVVVNTEAATFEASAGRWNPDLAFRWSLRTGIVDMGITHFYGTHRIPTLLSAVTPSGEPELRPHYPLMEQTGLDMQVTAGAFLGKADLMVRGDGHYRNNYFASTVGGEYTFSQIFKTPLDLGLLLEYLFDSRGKKVVSFRDHIFGGVRLTLNDTGDLNFLAGAIVDRTGNNQVFIAETSRRFGANWKLALKGALFHITSDLDPLSGLEGDDYLQAEVTYYFLR